MPQLRLGWIGLLLLLAACDGTPDPRTLEGALSYMARALDRDDPRLVYKVIDERARHAMISIVADRREAARLVRETYPEGEREAALAALGDAAEVESAEALFARRCDRACREELGAKLGAPVEVREEGDVTVVKTARGAELRWFRGGGGRGWYGLEWHTEELSAERDRANRDLAIVRENAATYERRRALEAASP